MLRLPFALVAAATAAAVASAGLLVTGAARAQPADSHAAASALVQQLEADGKQNAGHRTATADALRDAKDALERATRFRVAGDEGHAKAADGLALEWAETARDLVIAADAESNAADLHRKALDMQAQLERSRALVEEAIASIGRLQAELDQATHAGGAAHEHTAVEVHDGEPAPPKKKGGDKRDGASKPGQPARTDKTDKADKADKKDAGGTP
jgi:hypothetical protein